jgi:hypothetical protein
MENHPSGIRFPDEFLLGILRMVNGEDRLTANQAVENHKTHQSDDLINLLSKYLAVWFLSQLNQWINKKTSETNKY